jgi:hypothetical protein
MKKTTKPRAAGQQLKRQRDRGLLDGDPEDSAVDVLDRAYHKLSCFAALFGGDEQVFELIDQAGAWIILSEILEEIEKAGVLLEKPTVKREGGEP